MRRGASEEFNTSNIITDYIVRHSMFIVVFLVILVAVLLFEISKVRLGRLGFCVVVFLHLDSFVSLT